MTPVAVEDGFTFEGEFLPHRPCRERLDEVSGRLARPYCLTQHTVAGILLLRLSGLTNKDTCTQRACEKYGESCPLSVIAQSCSS
jgi:hypothetical protein